MVVGARGQGLQLENGQSAGDQRRGHGGRPPVHDVRHGSNVRNVRQPRGQAPGPGCQGPDVPALARGERAAVGVAAGAQLRLVDGRGAAGRVGGRSAECGHGAVLRRAGRGRARRRPPETGLRGRGRGSVGRVLRARVQRAVLRRLRRG